MHNHCHSSCIHLSLAYCAVCDVAYCKNCGREWGSRWRFTHLPSTWDTGTWTTSTEGAVETTVSNDTAEVVYTNIHDHK
jgi:hypothetical protein